MSNFTIQNVSKRLAGFLGFTLDIDNRLKSNKHQKLHQWQKRVKKCVSDRKGKVSTSHREIEFKRKPNLAFPSHRVLLRCRTIASKYYAFLFALSHAKVKLFYLDESARI